MGALAFDPDRETDQLQEAVRRHDRALLERLVSDRFVFVSGRSLGRLGKGDWIAAALQVEWQRFVVSIARVVDLDRVVIVDHDTEQEMARPPAWGPEAPTRTRWITTDVWVEESGIWRLVSRHPEMTA